MGFLKKSKIYFLAFIFLGGCAPSLIKLENYQDEFPYSQYGRTAKREFIANKLLDSVLIEKWESSINGGFSNSSITFYDSAVFVNDLSGRIFCFSIKNGKTLGQLKFKGSIFTAPIIHNSMIIFALVSSNENFSTLYYYDFKTGEEISAVELRGRVTNQLLKLEDGIIVLSENGILSKYDFDAKLIWQTELNTTCHSNPASDNSIITFGNDAGEIVSVNAKSGKIIYRKNIGGPIFSGAVIYENELFIGNDDGKLFSIELSSGNINWSFQTGAMIKTEAIVNEIEIFIENLGGEFFKLSRHDAIQLWKIQTDGLLNITPLLTDEFVILPDANKKIYLISRGAGEIVNSIDVDGRVKLNPVIKDDLLFIGYENGNLRAYETVD